MTKNDKEQIDFSPPDVGDYKKRISEVKRSHLPIGGAEMPAIPRLDQAVPSNRHEGVQTRGGTKPMTHEEYLQAVSTGQAIQGVGGAYQANQPRGFVTPKVASTPQMEITSTDGKPVNPPRAEGGLRPETQDALKALADANTDKKILEKNDEEYLHRLGEETTNILHNKERREYIESKIEDDLNFDDLLFQQELRQSVPIRKNFVPTFRTPSAAEDLFVKRLMSKEEGSAQFIVDKYASMGLVCGLFALNGKPFPDHCDAQKVPKEELFLIKYETILRYPLILIADLNANFVWFEDRVKKLMSLDTIKGF